MELIKDNVASVPASYDIYKIIDYEIVFDSTMTTEDWYSQYEDSPENILNPPMTPDENGNVYLYSNNN